MAEVKLRGISKSYGPVRVFEGFDLEVRDGELLSLLGPSGSGKTTLIRLIAGLEPLSQGSIAIGTRDVTALEPRARRIGMTFQGYALYPHLSVRRNLRYPLEVRHVGRAEADRRVADVANLLGIGHLLDRRIRQISGGEQQRVAIGRAIVQQPDLYLLDEPISNLDASLREQVRGEIRRLQQQLGATMIMVTHDQLDALAVSDRIAVLRKGTLEQIGTPEVLYRRPRNMFVAAFIGQSRMNFLAGHLSDREEGTFEGDGFSLPLPAEARTWLRAATREIVVGFRPEAVEIVPEPEPGAVPVTAANSFFHGEHRAAFFRLGGETVRAMLPAGNALHSGAGVWLKLGAGTLHFFDHASGRRLAGETEESE